MPATAQTTQNVKTIMHAWQLDPWTGIADTVAAIIDECGEKVVLAPDGLQYELLLKGTTTAFVGDFANFCVGCSMVLPAVIIYHIRKTKPAAVMGLIVGTICLTVFGSAFSALYSCSISRTFRS